MDQRSKEQLNIREITKEDVPQAFDIECRSFNDGPWIIDAFHHEIKRNNFAKYFVLESEQRIIDYLNLRVVIDQTQTTTVTIDNNCKGYDLGRVLLEHGINCVGHACDVMSLEVRADSKMVQHVYGNLGFQYDGKHKNYYGEGENTIIMWVNLNG